MIKEEIRLLHETNNVAKWYALDYKNLYNIPIDNADIDAIEDIINKIYKKIGDSGSSVMGGGLYANGRQIVKPFTQGNMAPETAYQAVEKYLSQKYPKIKFSIKYGAMD